MVSNPAYYTTESELQDDKEKNEWTISGNSRDEKVYTYDEAIDLAGNGWYSIGLLITLSMATLAMAVDMFGFSVIVSGCECEFQLDLSQKSILLSMPFIGPIVMAYPWGYISDTQGRKKSLLIAMWGSFLVSAISAFSTNWIWLAVFKCISTSFCSCAQSVTYALLGESCSLKMRDTYMLIMTSVLDFSLAFYVVIAYFILNMDFSVDMGLISFTPWRYLTIALALPLGLSAICLHFHYESPKFLVNVEREEDALEELEKIWKRNGRGLGSYPVKKLFLNEDGNNRRTDASFLESLWEQLVPLFKPPLLLRTLQLYYMTAAGYGTNNSFYIWFPFLTKLFTMGLSSTSHDTNKADGLCNMIDTIDNGNFTSNANACSSHMDVELVWVSLAQGASFVLMMLGVTKLASRKRALMISISTISSLSAALAVVINNNVISFIFFFGLLLNELCTGLIYSYIVDLYPTSYRGMAACLTVMVARASALAGVNLVGFYITTHCSATFYICSAYLFTSVIAAWFLPPDKLKR